MARQKDVNEGQASRVTPIVSVIIPTIRRPDLLRRALKSVLAQTFQTFEIIVVVDGPDTDTMNALQAETDPRIRVLNNPHPLGAGRSRNLGVAEARGRWVAFLDDDDEWLPDKLQLQLQLVGNREDVLVTCLSRIVRPQGVEVWPTSIYDHTRAFDEYLFDRRQSFAGASFIQTSSQLLPRTLYLKSPFPENSPHDDWEFVIRLACAHHVRVETVPEVLVVHYIGGQPHSLSAKDSWKVSLAWLAGMRALMTRRAYSGFCLGVVGPKAAKERDTSAILPILLESFRNGSPRCVALLFFLVVWLMPEDFRKRVRLLLKRGSTFRAIQQSSIRAP